MYQRELVVPENRSFFLFGPRGTGKSTWVRSVFPNGLLIDLLESEAYNSLLAHPERLEGMISPDFKDWVIIDEVQRVPELLNEVHRLIENRRIKFVLTGSSARKLRQKGVNLLAGRASTRSMHPLTASELTSDFSLDKALTFGHLPSVFHESDPKDYLKSYVQTYLREEVQQEGLTRNLSGFARFLESASFSQGSVLNISDVARDCAVNRKVATSHFEILEDLLLAHRLPSFNKRTKRRIVGHPKFYFFDCGIYRAIRPKGPLDRPEEIDGVALETLVFQELRAMIDNRQLDYELFYWRTSNGLEVDFILYGEGGLIGIEVKRAAKIRPKDFSGLKAFKSDYPAAKCFLFYGGKQKYMENDVELIPISMALRSLPKLIRG